MNRNNLLNTLLSVLGAACVMLLTGCYTVAVEYEPMHALADASAAPTVRLEIIDARPEDQGLDDGKLIGQYRGSFGIPNGVENGASGVMPATVEAVTVDALAGAGVAVDPASDQVLTANVTQFWADGMMGIGGWVTVDYTLGEAAWTATLEGEGGGGGAFSNQVKAVEEAVEEALVDLAAKASEAFGAEDFQTAVR